MKNLNQYITEYIIKKKLDKPIDSEHNYDYYPKTKDELIENLNELISKDIYDFNCIDTSNITDMSHLFDMSLKKLIKHNLGFVNFDISDWNVSKVENMEYMFYDCKNFDCDLSKWNVSNVISMSSLFNGCKNFKGKGLENWDVSKVENMQDMFEGCKKFTGKSIENWNISNVKYMDYMFDNCDSLDADFSNWDVSNVTNMSNMFKDCTSLKNKPSWYEE